MLDEAPKFNSTEIGKLTIKLQMACLKCSNKDNCPDATCPVQKARAILGDYLRTNNEVLADFDFNQFKSMPDHIKIDNSKLEDILIIVHNLCQKCMFHGDKCFINIVYYLLEVALGRKEVKPPSQRPGESAV